MSQMTEALCSSSSSSRLSQRGGIITSWLLKLVIFLAILGVLAFEVGAVVVATVNVDSVADAAATEAATTFGNTHNVDEARAAAAEKCKEGGASLISFSVSSDQRVVTVTAQKTAKTLFIQKIGFLRRFVVSKATHSAPVT
ncbi:MAG: hypothetical protein ACYDCC_01320 [Actinomycetota bacterium]